MDGQCQSLIEMTIDMEDVHTGFNSLQILDYNISQSLAFSYFQPLSLKAKQGNRNCFSLRACSINP